MSLTIAIERFISKYVFGAPCILFKASKSKQVPEVRRILVNKFWALGDSIVLLPTLQALKKQFPQAELHVLAHPRNKVVFEGQPFIDSIVDFSFFNIIKSIGKYDVCIDAEPALNVSAVVAFMTSKYAIGFNHGIRSRLYNGTVLFNKEQHMVQNYLDCARILGVKSDLEKLIPLVISSEEKKFVSDYMKKNSLSNKDFIVCIAPGVAESVKYRMWPIENVAKLADMLVKKHKAKIVLVDSKMNEGVIQQIQSLMKEKSINAVPEFGSFSKIKMTAELMKNCSVVISNDSGPMHVAACMGAKTIGLFGPNRPSLWGPFGKHNIALAGKKPGCPYMDNTNPDLLPKTLTQDQLTCMDAISVDTVLKAVEKLKK
jgi:heptosyltransferase-2